ncbi:SH3 and cysteine-rich domain-containing protein isoform X2 [Scyliorhinus torazame]|uniref:SH3 and cysteine-rich domain-containing protein isoform X2 n=1 Tax=Scyliorhinus torazame TaxID=75743 RepID=UPI003B5CA8A7
MPNRELAEEEESGAETEVESGANPAADEMEKENERVGGETPVSPVSTLSQRESKLQKLKRSLSFKAKGLRSKSADNFFQRTSSETKLQVELLPGVSSSTGQLPVSESQTSTPTRTQRQAENRTHSFLEYIFKKPTFCDTCNHMIVGTNAKLGLRCKACKMSIHHKCIDGVEQQRCMGKLSSDLAEVPEEGADTPHGLSSWSRKYSDSVFGSLENGLENIMREERKPSSSLLKAPGHKDTLQHFNYVALYRFIPQENDDLEMQAGDRIFLLDDSNEEWWKGKIADRVGYFPATFVQKVMTGEKVFRCSKPFRGSKEEGQINVKENQICVDKGEEINGFIKVRSGKKKGFVPLDILVNI